MPCLGLTSCATSGLWSASGQATNAHPYVEIMAPAVYLQGLCKGCAKDIMAAGPLCPICRVNIQGTIKARF